MAITFHTQEIKFILKHRNTLKAWMKEVMRLEKKSCGKINVVFCSDECLLAINQKFLKHNTYTDIITFDYNEGNTCFGEIYISIDRVQENAKKYECSMEQELHRILIHGVLHLCGYSDKTGQQKQIMRKKEEKALVLLRKTKSL